MDRLASFHTETSVAPATLEQHLLETVPARYKVECPDCIQSSGFIRNVAAITCAEYIPCGTCGGYGWIINPASDAEYLKHRGLYFSR